MKKKIIIISSLVLIVFLCFFLYLNNKIFANIDHNKKYNVNLSKCVDGDTAWFIIDGLEKKYRFLAIDTPERNDEFGNIISEYTCNILNNAKTIEIEYDEVGQLIDKYDRDLVWVYVDGVMLQEILLEKGYAKIKYIYANYNYLENLYDIENNAIDRKVGIWNNYNYEIYSSYYTLTFNYEYNNKEYKVLKNNRIELIENPYKKGCRFIGWKNGNYLFDLSRKINKNYNLEAKFEC